MQPGHCRELRGGQPFDMFLKNSDMALVRATQVKSDLRIKLIVTVAGYIRHLILLTGLAPSRNILFVY